MQSVSGSATVQMQSVAAKTARTGSIGSRSHVDMHVEENEEELGVVLPVPPQVAQTTTRKVAGLGPAMGATYAAGMLHRMALHGQTDDAIALLRMREGEEYGIHSSTPLVDVNLYDNQGMTALHYAASCGFLHMCELLLEEHADPNIPKQNNGFSALHFACENGHVNIAKLLVKQKADVNFVAKATSSGGKVGGDLSTPLHSACISYNNHDKLEIVTALLEGLACKGALETAEVTKKTADVTKVDAGGNTPLHVAASKCVDKVVQSLINKGANVDAKNSLGETPLFNAVYNYNISAVEALLTWKADAKAESNNKDAPIRVCAAEEVRLKKSMLALKSVKGGERMLSADQRTTLASLASHANNVQVIMEMLIEKGAYVRKTDRLLQKGIPTLETFDHLRRKNADNEMRAINKAAGLGELTDDEVKRAQQVLSMRQQKEKEEEQRRKRTNAAT